MTSPALQAFANLDTMPEERITDKITRRMVVGEKGMLVIWRIKAGAHAAAHSHPHEQFFWIVSGKMDFRVGDDRRLCGPGAAGVVPGGVEHEAWFAEDTEVIDFFAPPREDFLAAAPPVYMQQG